MSIKSQIESILFVATKALSVKQLANVIGSEAETEVLIDQALIEIEAEYNQPGRGINLINNGNKYQLVSSPENSEIIKEMIKAETTDELSRPSLEALTVIAYRGPITKAELEQIRGVNCSLILRNLLMRGLVEAQYDKIKAVTLYNITLDFMRYLGISSVKDLPDFEKLNSDERLVRLLDNSGEIL